jgi:hypothetical protein
MGQRGTYLAVSCGSLRSVMTRLTVHRCLIMLACLKGLAYILTVKSAVETQGERGKTGRSRKAAIGMP